MRKLAVLVVVVLALACEACCSSKLEKVSLDKLEASHEHIFTRYLGYVGRDPALSDKAKQSEALLVEEVRGTVRRLQKRVEE